MNPPGSWHCLTETATEEWARLSEQGFSQPYFYLVAHGIFGLVLDRFGGGRGPDARLFFTLNAYLKIDVPLPAGNELRVYIQPIRRSEKVIDTGISILDTASGARLAYCHHTGAYINRVTRRIDPLGDIPVRLWDEQVLLGGLAEPMLPMQDRDKDARKLDSLEGVIEPAWIDRMGHMGIEHYGLILDRACASTLKSLSPPKSIFSPKRIQVRYLKEIQLGEPFHVSSWISQDVGAAIRIEQDLCSGTSHSPRELAARCVQWLGFHPSPP